MVSSWWAQGQRSKGYAPGAPEQERRPGQSLEPAAASGPQVKGASVVMVPGLGLGAPAWARVAQLLGVPHRTVLLPSMGLRAPAGTDLSVPAQSRRLLGELALADPAGVVLVGHSASCPVVVHTALSCPAVRGLVLVGPVTDPQTVTWPAMLSQWARTAARECWWQLPVLVPQYRRTGLLSMLRGMDAVRRHRIDHDIQQAQVPLIVVHGARDRIATRTWSARLAAAGNGTSRMSVDSAHMVPLTDPGAIADAVRMVLGDLS